MRIAHGAPGDNGAWQAALAEVRVLLRRELRRRLPDKATVWEIEDECLRMSREIFGPLLGEELTQRAAEVPVPERCRHCGEKVRVVDRARERRLTGMVGEGRYVRPYVYCSGCGQGEAPADDVLAIGAGSWTPSLMQAAARLGIEASFARAAEALGEAIQLPIPEEDVRRITEGIGVVAEAEQQAAVERAQCGEEKPGPATSETLLVAVDACKVHVDGDWHDSKVAACAPLGPKQERDEVTGRLRWAIGRQRFAVGLEDADRFWYRTYALAVEMGLGERGVRHVVAIGDGAEWIWKRTQEFLALPGVKVTEIVDICHARQHIWKVAHVVFGEGTAAAAAWAEPLSEALLEEGVEPVIAALERLTPSTEKAQHEVELALEYFRRNAHRMRYPAFAAQGLPLGSGIVESACKLVVEARAKGSGMRWKRQGAQAVASLRALHRSGEWKAFWARNPHMRRPPARALIQRAA